MSRVTLDPVLRAKLNGLQEPLEVCDEGGKTIGHFLPEDAYRRILHTLAQSQITDEEIAKLRQQKGGRTLAEIWQSLRKP
jgi:hypothetical protein